VEVQVLSSAFREISAFKENGALRGLISNECGIERATERQFAHGVDETT
jgi:hypothetical protein